MVTIEAFCPHLGANLAVGDTIDHGTHGPIMAYRKWAVHLWGGSKTTDG